MFLQKRMIARSKPVLGAEHQKSQELKANEMKWKKPDKSNAMYA